MTRLWPAWLGTTLAFGAALSGINLLSTAFWGRVAAPDSLLALLASLPLNLALPGLALAFGLGAREGVRQHVARHYGIQATTVANPRWALLAVVPALFGWFVVAPLASRVTGSLRLQAAAHLAMAGPLVNLALSLLHFAALSTIFVWRLVVPGWLASYGYAGFLINAWLALVVLWPAGPFDGVALLAWRRTAYALLLLAALLLTFVLSNEQVLLWLLALVTR